MPVTVRARPGSYVVDQDDPEFLGLLDPDCTFKVACSTLPRSAISATVAAHPDGTDAAREAIMDDLMFARIVMSDGFETEDGEVLLLSKRESFDLFREHNPAFARALGEAMARKENAVRVKAEAVRRD